MVTNATISAGRLQAEAVRYLESVGRVGRRENAENAASAKRPDSWERPDRPGSRESVGRRENAESVESVEKRWLTLPRSCNACKSEW